MAAASDLPDHPALARPFTSKTLTELTNHARLMAQKEKNTLWRLKHMFTKLGGDHTWIPTAMLETPNDLDYFGDKKAEYRAHLMKKRDLELGDAGLRITDNGTDNDVEMDEPATAEAPHPSDLHPQSPHSEKDDVVMGEAVEANVSDKTDKPVSGPEVTAENSKVEAGDKTGHVGDISQNDAPPSLKVKQPSSTDLKPETSEKGGEAELKPTSTEKAADDADDEDQAEDPDSTILDPEVEAEANAKSKDESGTAAEGEEGEEDGQDDQDGDNPPPRRMRTRAQAQAATDDSVPSRNRSLSAASNDSFVHPYFVAPVSSLPDRDFMLPPSEADESRRMLQLYIQKQEEICRGAEKLYMGLLKADRQRKQVMSWARADRHVGEMSDGEDWVDEEEWMLDEPLKKGMDDEEEEAVPTGKKTRARRQ